MSNIILGVNCFFESDLPEKYFAECEYLLKDLYEFFFYFKQNFIQNFKSTVPEAATTTTTTTKTNIFFCRTNISFLIHFLFKVLINSYRQLVSYLNEQLRSRL